MRNCAIGLLVAVALAGIVACGASKSANPLSPSVAGPIAGVDITAPTPVEPRVGVDVDNGQQPVTLTVENATTSGQRPLSYRFEVASDSQFTTLVYTREGILPGESGRTSLRLPDPLATDRTYYWRARAQDGANTGPFSPEAHFTVVTPIVFQAPALLSPTANQVLTGRRVTFAFQNVTRTGPAGPVRYAVHVATNESFSQMVSQFDVAEQSGTTSAALNQDLAYQTTFFWRVRPFETSRNTVGPWSVVQAFRTPSEPTTPTPTPPPNPSPGTWPSNGPDVVAYVERQWPSYLAAGVSSSQRAANMEFLRDRIIETGICGGMNLGLNLKRGGPEISKDYVTYYTGGRWIGVDVGAAYDDTSQPLRLQWVENPNDPYATHLAYSPRPTCK